MKVFIRSKSCSHLIFADDVGSTAEINDIVKSMAGLPCEKCAITAEGFDVHVDSKEFDQFIHRSAVSVRDTSTDFVESFRETDRAKSEDLLQAKGGHIFAELLDPIRASVLRKIPENLRGYLSLIPIGLISSYTINASTWYVKSESSIPFITFHWGLASYIFCMNRTVVPLFNLTYLGEEAKTGGIAHSATLDEAAATRMSVHAVKRFLMRIQEPPDLPEFTDTQKAFEMPLTRSIEMFVLAHEYAHAILGHNESLSLHQGKPEFITRAWEHEFEADAWAQKLLSGRFEREADEERSSRLDDWHMSEEFSQAAPLLFFLYEEFLRQIVCSSGQELIEGLNDRETTACLNALACAGKSEDHPPPMDRFMRMKELLDSIGNWRARHLVRLTADVISVRLERLFGKGIKNPMGKIASIEEKAKLSDFIGSLVDEYPKHFVELPSPVVESLEKELEKGIYPPAHQYLPTQDKKLSALLSELEPSFWAADECRKQKDWQGAVAGFNKCLQAVEKVLQRIEGESKVVGALRIMQSSCYFKLADILSPFDMTDKRDIGASRHAAEDYFLRSIAVAYSYQYSGPKIMMYLALQQIAKLRSYADDYQGAIKAAKLAVKLEPDSCGAHLLLAEQLYIAGAQEESLECLLKATRCEQSMDVQSEKGRAFWNAAALALKIGRIQDAKQYLSSAVNEYHFGSVEKFLREEGVTSQSVCRMLRSIEGCTENL